MTTPRILPSIDELQRRSGVDALVSEYGTDAVTSALRAATHALRKELTGPGPTHTIADRDAAGELIEGRAARQLAAEFTPSLQTVLNATGVIVHTNLGRAPLAPAAAARAAAVAAGYGNLEYDLSTGGRGSRSVHAERLLRLVTGAPAAVVVNNNAAAVLLILGALASGREVIVSRGELVEIGGGFRVPDVMRQSGAEVREVGTTNRTRVSDYAAAISHRTALILRVHPSNFRIEGFTERPALDELVALGRRFGVPVAEDLGSGYLLETPTPGLTDESTVAASIDAGVSVCCFSGDKLLGGPQAGIVIGDTEPISRIRQHPLMRALRVDKMTYAALEATLLEYARGRAAETVPVIRMLRATAEEIGIRATALASRLNAHPLFEVDVVDGVSTVGGGSAPGSALPTRVVRLTPRRGSAARLDTRLRQLRPPVVGRIEQDRLLLDLRTVLSGQDDTLAEQLEGLTPSQ
jgi:L-seryl-tRNA(Ser) seleniumtransferase